MKHNPNFISVKLQLGEFNIEDELKDESINLYVEFDEVKKNIIEKEIQELIESLKDDVETVTISKIIEFGGGRIHDSHEIEKTIKNNFLKRNKNWDYNLSEEGEFVVTDEQCAYIGQDNQRCKNTGITYNRVDVQLNGIGHKKLAVRLCHKHRKELKQTEGWED